MKIISGGQSGVDIAALMFADKYGIENEVNIFKNFKPIRNESYPKTTKVNYVCNENKLVTYSDKLRCRTKYNVLNSDITLILVNKPIEDTKGSLLTFNLCKTYNKPRYVININNLEQIKKVGTLNNYNIINIAGQRDLDNLELLTVLEIIWTTCNLHKKQETEDNIHLHQLFFS